MTSSIAPLSAYAVLLVAILLTPYASTLFAPSEKSVGVLGGTICALLFFGAIILTMARHTQLPLLAAFLLLPLARLGVRSLLGGATAALLFATVTWWTPATMLTPMPMGLFILLALIAAFLPHWVPLRHDRNPQLTWPMLLCGLIGLAMGLLTAPFESLEPLNTAWHHWGALLAPVEAWRGGGVPYRDFPIQYGLGPTALLLASCGQDCWRGMYETAIATNALYFVTLCGSTIILTRRLPRGVRWLALLAMFCATFVWTGFPIQFAGPAMTPAVAGIRFLSISALVFHILLTEERQVRRDWIGHIIWLIDLFWSPEAAFFGTLIWWPYLALRDAAATEGGSAAWMALFRGAARATIALSAGILALIFLLWLISAGSITVETFFAYIAHPPGMRSINPVGTIWLALASITLAIFLVWRRGISSGSPTIYTCLLGLTTAGIYYMSRSHDNNILNLFPLLILLLLAILADAEHFGASIRSFVEAFAYTILAAMAAYVTTFNFGPWREGIARAGFLTFGPARMISRLTAEEGATIPLFAPDAAVGLQYMRKRNAGMVLLFDYRLGMPRAVGETTWTGVNNAANFVPLPRPMIVHYIKRGAEAYRRPGWILVDAEYGWWVDAFKTAYDVREQKSFGSYRAFYMVPRGHVGESGS